MDTTLKNYDEEYPNTIQPFVVLYDTTPNGPFTYEQWGNEGIENFPYIISDSNNLFIGEWFDFGEYPLNIIIDQNMEIFQIIDGKIDSEELEFYFNQLNN